MEDHIHREEEAIIAIKISKDSRSGFSYARSLCDIVGLLFPEIYATFVLYFQRISAAKCVSARSGENITSR